MVKRESKKEKKTSILYMFFRQYTILLNIIMPIIKYYNTFTDGNAVNGSHLSRHSLLGLLLDTKVIIVKSTYMSKIKIKSISVKC